MLLYLLSLFAGMPPPSSLPSLTPLYIPLISVLVPPLSHPHPPPALLLPITLFLTPLPVHYLPPVRHRTVRQMIDNGALVLTPQWLVATCRHGRVGDGRDGPRLQGGAVMAVDSAALAT